MNIRETVVDNFSDSNFTENQLVVIIFEQSQLKSFSGNTFDSMNKGLKIIKQTTGIIADSFFTNMVQNIKEGSIYQSNIGTDGSAIEIIDSNVTISNCTFSNNIAKNGGAVKISCDYRTPCSNSIENSSFRNNSATGDGGAIKYDSYAPTLTNNTYENNTGDYGPNIASYPVKIMGLRGSTLYNLTELKDIPSGEYIDYDIDMAIVDDSLNTVIKSIHSGSIMISAVSPSAHVKGSNTAALVNGTGTLKSVILESSPGDEMIKFKLKSSVIDSTLVKKINPVLYGDQFLDVDFRWCKPGEIQIDTICSYCTSGTYSVTWNATT
jgi:hypothetical protein